ncbi:hypothetical protein PLUA15_540030 [Pseudomonas lundensis]|uniref:STAS domain-containing protein n=1 Tax=Pseudomonas lundensis TaxID=86185 RepID=A0AAX2HEW1_9PSED|nr:hypothetical protein PLUA15_540030 [Pseudomonas lundensis]
MSFWWIAGTDKQPIDSRVEPFRNRQKVFVFDVAGIASKPLADSFVTDSAGIGYLAFYASHARIRLSSQHKLRDSICDVHSANLQVSLPSMLAY